MCGALTKEELEECCENPCFCIICMCNRDIPVDETHVCLECAEDSGLTFPNSFITF